MSSSKNECTLEGVWGCVRKRTRASKGGEEGGGAKLGNLERTSFLNVPLFGSKR